MFTGEQIRKKRTDLGLSADELAEQLGVKKANLYKWEKGHRPGDPKDYIKVENWLNDKVESVPNGNRSTNPVLQEDAATYEKTPTDKEGLMKALIASQNARIKLLEDKQAGDIRLIQVEATLQIVVGILNGLKIQDQPRTPTGSGQVVEEISLHRKNADKNESNVKQERHK